MLDKDADPTGGEADNNIVRDARASLDLWMQVAVRYFVLANAGAAVAALSFIGTSRSVPPPAILALFFFVTGVVVAGVVIMGQLTAAWRLYLNPSGLLDPRGVDASVQARFVTRWGDRVERRTASLLAVAFALFVAGAAVGLLALAFSW